MQTFKYVREDEQWGEMLGYNGKVFKNTTLNS